MENYQPAPNDKDAKLWAIARKRASFKSNFFTYLAVMTFLWALWYFTHGKDHADSWPWPIWPTLGWGLGVVMHFFGAYVYPEANSTEREYEKLKRKEQK